jgi:hypothetical protein
MGDAGRAQEQASGHRGRRNHRRPPGTRFGRSSTTLTSHCDVKDPGGFVTTIDDTIAHPMKLVFCCRRRPELSAEQFQGYWLDNHAALVRSVRATIPSMTRYVQSHTMFGPLTDGVRDSRGTGEPYDGVAEIWLDFSATPEDPESMAEAMKKLLDDELSFVDMSRSSVFITKEHVIF